MVLAHAVRGGGGLVVRIAAGLVFDRSTAPIGRELLWSAGLMVALVVLVGVLSLIDFKSCGRGFTRSRFGTICGSWTQRATI